MIVWTTLLRIYKDEPQLLLVSPDYQTVRRHWFLPSAHIPIEFAHDPKLTAKFIISKTFNVEHKFTDTASYDNSTSLPLKVAYLDFFYSIYSRLDISKTEKKMLRWFSSQDLQSTRCPNRHKSAAQQLLNLAFARTNFE